MNCIKTKLHQFNSFDGGINKSLLKTEIAETELYDCLNMWYDNGTLKTRDGLNFKNRITLSDIGDEYTIKLLSADIYSNDTAIKIYLLSRSEDDIFYNKLLIIKSDSTYSCFDLWECDKIHYTKDVTSVNCTLIRGKSTCASGYYILAGAVDSDNNICDKKIFEISEDFSSVIKLNPDQIYAPMVLVNGRGNKYMTLSASQRDFPKSSMLEDFNLISSGFRSCFKTDGVSFRFYLPAKKLSEKIGENIIITYTSADGSVYNWTIPYNVALSNYVLINGKKYGFSVNRSVGSIYVHNDTGQDLPLPAADGIYNNLEILAYKEPDSDMLFKMTVSESFNSRVFLSGNKDEGNIVCFSKQNNPLYFPKSNISYFGDKSGIVTAIKQQNDRLIIFKAHQIGICSAIHYSDYRVDLILLGKSVTGSANERMEIKTINTGIGCIYPETLINCANRLVFLGSNKKVYTITSTSNYLQRLYQISSKIDNLLYETEINENAFAIDYKNNYMLFLDNKCFLFNYNTKAFLSASSPNGSVKQRNSIAWYYFEYNSGASEIFSAINLSNTALIIAKYNNSSGTTHIMIYDLSGTTDDSILSNSTFKPNSIPSRFTTKASSFKTDCIKRITELSITFGEETYLSSSPISVKYINENKFENATQINISGIEVTETVIRKIPFIFGVRNFGFSLERNAPFSVKCAGIKYKVH